MRPRRSSTRQSPGGDPPLRSSRPGRSLFALAVALLVFGIVVLGILILLSNVIQPDTGPPTATVVVPTVALPVNPTAAPRGESWLVTYEYRFPTLALDPGQHSYSLSANCPALPTLSGTWRVLFDVSPLVPVRDRIYLRPRGVGTQVLGESYVTQINPSQELQAVLSMIFSSRAQADAARMECNANVTLDDGNAAPLQANIPEQQ